MRVLTFANYGYTVWENSSFKFKSFLNFYEKYFGIKCKKIEHDISYLLSIKSSTEQILWDITDWHNLS